MSKSLNPESSPNSLGKGILMIESCEKKQVSEDFSNTSIVHVRNSLIMRSALPNSTLVSHISQIPDALGKKYDHIICHYASPYMKYKAYMALLEANPKAKLWWLCNDFDVEDNILLRNHVKATHGKYSVICNNPRAGYRHWILGKNIEGKKLNDWIDEWHTVNLNSLIVSTSGEVNLSDKRGCIYFGTYRKHRAEDMALFNGIEDYFISSSTKNQEKYRAANIQAQFIDRINWKIGEEDLRKFKYSIYFEDNHTHKNYAYLANRFYECLMFDVVLFFDRKCQNTISEARKSGYFISDFLLVEDAKEMNDKMKQINNSDRLYKFILSEQRQNLKLALKEKQYTLDYIEKILTT